LILFSPQPQQRDREVFLAAIKRFYLLGGVTPGL
jgi:hypothetical protein